MTKGTEQRRSSQLMRNEALEKIRIQTWFFHVVERALGADLDEHLRAAWQKAAFGTDEEVIPLARSLQCWLDEQSAGLDDAQIDAVTQLTARDYDKGLSSPQAFTLGVFESLLPDSQAMYDAGPLGEPLWKILDGDLTTCLEYLDQAAPVPESVDAGPEVRLQAIMDALIAPAYQLKVDEIPDLGQPQQSPHPVWLSRVNEMHRAVNERDDSQSVLEAVTNDDQVLAAIALWQLVWESGLGPLLRLEWLIAGLCYGSIADAFNVDVQTFILRLLEERAGILEKRLARRGVTIVPFSARWTPLASISGANVANMGRRPF